MSSLIRRNPEWVANVMEEDCFTHLSIYKKNRPNHKSHAIYAVACLGFSEERTKSYLAELNKYIPELKEEDEMLAVPGLVDHIKSDKLEDYRGKNSGFYVMKEKYDEMLNTKYDGDVIQMIKDCAPEMIDGPLFSTFHSFISIAYGYVGHSKSSMLEGLLFMDHQFSAMILDEPNHPRRKDLSKFGHGKTNILDMFQKLHDNTELRTMVQEENVRDEKLKIETHMMGVYGWPASKYHGKFFLDTTDDIKFPKWFDPSKEDMDQLFRLIDWFCDMAVVVYVKSEDKNDFFLLHGITAAWSYRQICHLFEYKTALLGFRALVAAVLAVYVVQSAPKLSRSPEEFFTGEVNEEKWNTFIKGVVEEKTFYEFHVYKVIQCCHEFWLERKEYADYYYAAAVSAKGNCYSFGPGNPKVPQDDLSV